MRLFSFLSRGISRRGARAGKLASRHRHVFWYSCMGDFVSSAGDFSTNARNGNVYVWFYQVSHCNNVTRVWNDGGVSLIYTVILPDTGGVTRLPARSTTSFRPERRFYPNATEESPAGEVYGFIPPFPTQKKTRAARRKGRNGKRFSVIYVFCVIVKPSRRENPDVGCTRSAR